jgi:small subunit ribosomal protein S1
MANPPPFDRENDFGAMLAEFEAEQQRSPKQKEPREGDVVRGPVVSIGQDAVFVDLGGKADGMIDLAEVLDGDRALTVKVGDEIEATVVDVSGKNGCVVLRRKLGAGRGAEGRAELMEAFTQGIPVEGVISGVNKGGVEVQIAGTRCFCPISQLDLRHVEDAAAFVGQRLSFRVTKCEESARGGLDCVVSRRALLEEDAQDRAKETEKHLAVGAVLRGRVTTLKDYGAFVDLGGLEGMLHISQLGFQRVAHPKDVLAIGQEIDVQVIKLEKSDDPKRPLRISLSLKSLERDPWHDAVERFPEGARLPGTVRRLETFGAFVELSPGIEGLLHVGELGEHKRVRHPKELLKIGQALEVMVLSVDREQRRISLGLAKPGEAADGPLPSAPAGSLGTFADLLKKKR